MENELNAEENISKGWVYFSLFLFMVIEIGIAYWFAYYFRGQLYGHVTALKLEVVALLSTYFVGGFVIGFFSPAVRVYEPAIAAFLSTLLAFLISFFTPHTWIHFDFNKALIGGSIASICAMAGADLGERAAAKLGNRASGRYAAT